MIGNINGLWNLPYFPPKHCNEVLPMMHILHPLYRSRYHAFPSLQSCHFSLRRLNQHFLWSTTDVPPPKMYGEPSDDPMHLAPHAKILRRVHSLPHLGGGFWVLLLLLAPLPHVAFVLLTVGPHVLRPSCHIPTLWSSHNLDNLCKQIIWENKINLLNLRIEISIY